MDVRGKRELRRKRDTVLSALVVIIAVAILLGVGFFFVKLLGLLKPQAELPAAPPEAVTEPVAERPVETVSPEPLPEKLPEESAGTAAVPQDRFVISLLGDCTLSSSHYTNHFESTVGGELAYPFSNVAALLSVYF